MNSHVLMLPAHVFLVLWHLDPWWTNWNFSQMIHRKSKHSLVSFSPSRSNSSIHRPTFHLSQLIFFETSSLMIGFLSHRLIPILQSSTTNFQLVNWSTKRGKHSNGTLHHRLSNIEFHLQCVKNQQLLDVRSQLNPTSRISVSSKLTTLVRST